MLTLIKLSFFKVVFTEGQFDPPVSFIFQEELSFYEYNFMQLLNNLYKVD